LPPSSPFFKLPLLPFPTFLAGWRTGPFGCKPVVQATPLEGEERRRSEGTSLYRPSGGSYRFNRRNLPDGLDRYLIRCATITHEQLTVGGMLTGAARVRRVPETVGQPA
jgi:hypothetical protein